MRYDLNLPLNRDMIKDLVVGDEVYLNGKLLVGRDQVHLRLTTELERDGKMPVSLIGETIFYMGPAPAPQGFVIGSCGPTTSARMDPFAPTLMREGLIAMIGKGPRSESVRNSLIDHGCVYFTAFGGCGALYAQCVRSVRVIAYEDLGPEALYEMVVEDFPVIVAMDAFGASIYDR